MQPVRKIKDKSERRIKRKDSIVKAKLTCPICRQQWKSTAVRHKSALKTLRGTCDCPKCGGLILIEDGKLKAFHKEMHNRHSFWPEDGAGAFSIGVPEGDVRDESDKARRKR